MELTIETMTPADWDSVRAIYREGIATGDATFETDAPDWEPWDRNHLPAGRLVARAGHPPRLGTVLISYGGRVAAGRNTQDALTALTRSGLG